MNISLEDKWPKVSIIVLNWNRKNLTARGSIKGLLNEIILFLNIKDLLEGKT